MPPPSLERKEQLLSWQQKDKLKGPFKPEDRQRRRNTIQLSPVPFTPEPKQNSYTEQFRRRRSQQELADQSPRANGSRRMERRRSSEDAGERRNGLHPSLHTEEKLDNRRENGHHHSPAAVDAAVEKKLPRSTEDVVAAVSGKGIGCSLPPMDRDQRKATMTKKRRAPCGRSTVALAVVAGVATVTVAGGLMVCRLHPSSPAAASIRIAVGKVEQTLIMLLKNEVMPLARALEEVVRDKGITLLRSRRLRSLARAADALVEQKLRGSLGFTKLAADTTVSFKLVEDIPGQLRSAVLAAIEALQLSGEGIQVHMQTLFKFIEQQMGEDTELLNQARSFLLAVVSSLTEVLRQCGEWTTSSLDRIGFKPGVIDESLSSDQFLSSLEGNRAAIQSIGRGITAQKSQTLQDVKRLKKRRATIASDTNEILSKTRDLALESVVRVKMAALDAIQLRLKQSEEQYARAVEQILKDNEQTLRQVEREGGAKLVEESQARVTGIAAAALKQYSEERAGEKLTVTEEQEASETESPDEHATVDQSHIEEEQESAVSPAVPTEQGSTEDLDLGVEEDVQISVEFAMENQATLDLVETLVVESTPSEGSLGSEHLAEEQESGSLEDVLVGDHICEDEAQVVEENLATDKEVETGEEKHSFVTEVFVDLNNGAVENTHEVTTLGSQNLSGGDTFTQEGTYMEKDRLNLVVSVEGTDMELDVEVGKVAYERTEQVEVEQVISDTRTRIAIQPGSVEKNVEEQHSDELMPQAENGFVHEEILVASDIEIEVQSEEMDGGVILEVEKDVNEVETVITALEHVGETDSVLRQETTVEQDTSPLDEGIAGDLQLEEAAREQEALEAKEIQELEQLEQVLLEEEGERVEEELRAIAEEEELWSRIDQVPSADEVTKENAEQVEVMKVTAELKNDSWRSSLGIQVSALPGPTLTQIGLFSVAFIGLAVLTAYLLVRYRKRGLLTQPPRRRKRWRKLADIDAEEVVLLPEVSSDEEDDKEQATSKMDVLEVASSISVKTTTMLTSEDEKADEEEKPSELIEEQGKPGQEEEKITPVSESLVSQTTVVELASATVDHTTTTPHSDASAVDSDLASVSTPPASRLEISDTSQRTRRRRRQIRT
ncbi:hypothetical protein V7S43_008087 [Phytophthora oleae]|uniref:Uncharacterized protein n=1 Tax=Phytophthora oleae TaxID=2107226 RepID=A0ABD3FK69_9STRA